jgi:thiol-disulfide isomerase/thioredoxin
MNLYVNGTFAQSYIGARSKVAIKSYLLHQHAKRTASTTTRGGNGSGNGTLVKRPNPNGRSIALNGRLLKQAIDQLDRPYFVKFYAPWCPHCQRLAPLWTRLAMELKNQVDVAEVNCDTHMGKLTQSLNHPIDMLSRRRLPSLQRQSTSYTEVVSRLTCLTLPKADHDSLIFHRFRNRQVHLFEGTSRSLSSMMAFVKTATR